MNVGKTGQKKKTYDSKTKTKQEKKTAQRDRKQCHRESRPVRIKSANPNGKTISVT